MNVELINERQTIRSIEKEIMLTKQSIAELKQMSGRPKDKAYQYDYLTNKLTALQINLKQLTS